MKRVDAARRPLHGCLRIILLRFYFGFDFCFLCRFIDFDAVDLFGSRCLQAWPQMLPLVMPKCWQAWPPAPLA
jgi:hypothetical protein